MTKSIRRNKTFKTKKSRKNKNKSNLKGGMLRRPVPVYRSAGPNTNGRIVSTNNPVQNLLQVQVAESCGEANALVLNIDDITGLRNYYSRNTFMQGKLNALITGRNRNSCNTYIIDSSFFVEEEEEEEEEESFGFPP